ncbi:acetolactate decarboxylase [Apilactobacillus micheneri]|uniref:Alpha-acetolactate decarboxylase n=1 Tax=Apilactobacillus micheneri TaxID=1899430 RepID=A0A9Q8INC3_9LACO|nr:acetolactate decarboxylase [Apilactobacillus micheneri]TPR39869.1 acetolactate decarboxylase [Apilactobacillus micheneri]TPR43790.1 acetolactate decarboxylase [Apilactobacillus micheneri]TPR45343.1 acetolactate decarboxylase [Apilactobacillus micheneri]TPR51034.1 acetolactate decarboxylase [Apilactobacillus micheneri]
MAKTNNLYQYGTLALLVPGLFKGTLKLSDLLKHGDTGIGTGDGLDGELVIKDGIPYQIDGHGSVNKLDGNFTVPFADVHFADYKKLFDVESTMTPDKLEEKVMGMKDWQNTFFSIKFHGTFAQIKTRSVDKQVEPYPTLVDCAHKQHEFNGENITGTVMGYYSPQLFNGSAVGGFHLHFIADDLSMGGHLLDFSTNNGEVSAQILDHLEQQLPVNDEEFMKHDFSKDDIAGAIGEAE